MTMTRKDAEPLAAVVRSTRERQFSPDELEEALFSILKSSNPRMDRQRFHEATLLKETP